MSNYWRNLGKSNYKYFSNTLKIKRKYNGEQFKYLSVKPKTLLKIKISPNLI